MKLEEWNLSSKLPGAFSFRQPVTNKIFQSMMKSCSFSIFISYFCFSTGAFKGRKFVILIAFPWSFSIFLKSSFFSWVKCNRLFIWHLLRIFFRPSKVWSIFHHALVAANSEWNEIILTLTLTLNLVLTFIVFHNFFFLSWFLWLYHFYGLFTAYLFMWGGNVSWLCDKSQSRCSFIVTPRYLTCYVREIYWSLILKVRCFIIFLLDSSLNIKISEYQNSRIIIENIGISHRLPVWYLITKW